MEILLEKLPEINLKNLSKLDLVWTDDSTKMLISQGDSFEKMLATTLNFFSRLQSQIIHVIRQEYQAYEKQLQKKV